MTEERRLSERSTSLDAGGKDGKSEWRRTYVAVHRMIVEIKVFYKRFYNLVTVECRPTSDDLHKTSIHSSVETDASSTSTPYGMGLVQLMPLKRNKKKYAEENVTCACDSSCQIKKGSGVTTGRAF